MAEPSKTGIVLVTYFCMRAKLLDKLFYSAPAHRKSQEPGRCTRLYAFWFRANSTLAEKELKSGKGCAVFFSANLFGVSSPTSGCRTMGQSAIVAWSSGMSRCQAFRAATPCLMRARSSSLPGPIWALARAHDWSGRAGLAAHNSLPGGTRRSAAAFSIERASATWSPGVGPGFSRSYEPRGNARVTRFSGGHYNQ